MLNNLSKERALGFTDESYKTFKELIIPILSNLSKKIEAEELIPSQNSETGITLILKPDNYHYKMRKI